MHEIQHQYLVLTSSRVEWGIFWSARERRDVSKRANSFTYIVVIDVAAEFVTKSANAF